MPERCKFYSVKVAKIKTEDLKIFESENECFSENAQHPVFTWLNNNI